MRICIVAPNLSDGGAEFVAKEWARWLGSTGHEVTVVVTDPRSRDEDLPGVDIHVLSSSSLAKRALELRNLYRQRRFDASVSLLPYYNILNVLAGLGTRRAPLIAISGRNVEVPFPEVHGSKVRTTRALSKALYPRADRFIAISHPVAAEALALYRIRPSQTFVVPNPATAKLDRQKVERRAPTDRSGIGIVVPGRLAAQKNPHLAIESAAILRQENREVSLHFFGDGPLREQLEAQAADAGVPTRFHGWVDRWFDALPDARPVVLLPSSVEGFGNVLVEATVAGVPVVVSSQCLGAADAVVPNVTGVLTMSLDPQELSAAILNALNIEIRDVDAWLTRFSAEASGRALLQALTR